MPRKGGFMFGCNERWYNFLVCKMWATDEEIEEMAPVFFVIGIVLVVGFFVVRGCTGGEPQNSTQQPQPKTATEQVE